MTGELAPTLTVEQIGQVRRLSLNRPDHHNPLSSSTCWLRNVPGVHEAEADTGTSVIIIRGTGRSFSSGYGFIAEDTDPEDFPRHETIEDDVSAMLTLADGWGRLWDCAIPVIAQVQGNCLAGGTDLALHCDFIVAADDAESASRRCAPWGYLPPTCGFTTSAHSGPSGWSSPATRSREARRGTSDWWSPPLRPMRSIASFSSWPGA